MGRQKVVTPANAGARRIYDPLKTVDSGRRRNDLKCFMNRLLPHIVAVLSLIASFAADASAFEQRPSEYQVKAVFLLNFINFIDWPADSSFQSDPAINVCVIGDDPFGDAIDAIRNETAKGKKMVVRFRAISEVPRGCQVVFIPAAENNHVGRIIRSIREPGVLTVADSEEGVRQGAIIGFFIEQKKVRFAVNIEAARRAGLKISAKLLKLARIVKSAE